MRLAVALVLLFSSAGSAAAQVPDLRFQGAPSDRCREFMILETSLYQTPFNNRLHNSFGRADNKYFNWEFGAMENVGRRSAWGGSLYFATDLQTGRVAILPRYRRWLTGHCAADLSAGPIVLDTDEHAGGGLAGGVGRLSFDVSSLISLTTQVDVLERASGWRGFGYIGIRVGSYVAVPASLFNLLVASSLTTPYFSPELDSPVPPN
jgi:hypothetical protein